MFQHHPDGYIVIGGVHFPLAFFQMMEPGYTLPEGMIGRTYVPNQVHKVYNQNSEFVQELDWTEGDNYIAKVSDYQLAFTRLQNRNGVDTDPLKRRVRPLWQ